MTIVDRRVRTLRIRAASDERARHAAILLEDALRTATIPGTSGARLVIIRHLDVGVVPSAASVAGVTLAVEVAAQRLAASAVHGESPHAGDAPAVYFRDETEALIALARRVARGCASTEWFWPLIVGGWPSSDSPESLAALLLDHALAAEMAAPTAAGVVAAFAAVGASSLLLSPLTEAHGIALLAASGWSGMNDAAVAAMTPASTAPQTPAATRALVAQWMARWSGPRDARAAWLAGMLLVAERPGRATSTALSGMVHGLLSSIAARGTAEGDFVETRAGVRSGDGSVVDAREWWEGSDERGVNSETGGPPSRTPRPDARQLPVPAPHADTQPENVFPLFDRPSDAPHRTAYAGLLFLVPLLTRLGIAELLAERTDLADHDWAEGLLLRLAYRLGIPADDPALAWLRGEGLAVAPADRSVTATWMRSIRSRSRRDTGRSLALVVRRTGVIAATNTHIDVFFRHTQVDVAIRRAGLDVDPGWVPWLGKVIRFHYVDAIADDT